MRRFLLSVMAAAALAIPATAIGAPLPDNCTKDKGTVTCTETQGPGQNQGGVGTTTETETQGNTTNKKPDPQELEDTCDKNPPNAQGGPIGNC